jgi:phosphoglycolate phosphatase
MSAAKIQFPQRLRAVLFDLDGTLVDTADEFVPAVQALRAEHDLAPMDPDRIRASVSNGARALVALGLGMDESASGFETQRLRLLDLYQEVLGSVAALYPGLPELLQRLDTAGIAWGISTNKPRPFTAPLLEKLDIQPAPGSVVCPEDISERKPHPETLYRNCRDLGCSPFEAIYIGDHLRDIEAGRRAGMYTIAAAYGYLEPGDDADNWGANVRADSSSELAALIFRE